MGSESSHIKDQKSQLSFLINGKRYQLDPQKNPSKITPSSMLVDFIREEAGLTGTKFMCREGGCGACVVGVKENESLKAVNSCLVPLLSIDGWEITTIEGISGPNKDFNQIQKNIVSYNATQCGFCTPGFVSTMHCLRESKPSFTTEDVEDTFDGNICRCTGYRSIMDAFKNLTPSQRICSKGIEIEDLDKLIFPADSPPLLLEMKSGQLWLKPQTLAEVFSTFDTCGKESKSCRIVAGNTASGVFKEDNLGYDVYIDISGISELSESSVELNCLKFGGGVNLSNTIQLLLNAGQSVEGFKYCKQIAKHLKRVANTPVRNRATLGGNLMLKHAHPEFPSDVFTLMSSIGAKLEIATAPNTSKEYSLPGFLKEDMKNKLILNIFLPKLPDGVVFKSYKITRRYQNSHAYVNSGMLFHLSSTFLVIGEPILVFGGISGDYIHASQTEKFLKGKILNKETFGNALKILENELQPDARPLFASPAYRKHLGLALFYKTVLSILGNSVQPQLKSGAFDLTHGPTQGTQNFDSDPSDWPLNQPIAKLEAMAQSSGSAQYVNDIQRQIGELAGAFVLTKIANADIEKVDASEALKIEGVVKFIRASDIPGKNNYAVKYPQIEEIFASSKSRYAGQPVGLVLAENREIALKAATKVSISYKNVQPPILDISTNPTITKTIETPNQNDTKSNKPQILKGHVNTPPQYHMTMETQSCLCIPTESGNMDVFPSSQFPDLIQFAISSATLISSHKISVNIRRIGGGYGSKISKAAHIASACAVAAIAVKRPVRIVMDLESNMKMIGKRLPFNFEYDVTFDGSGIILGLEGKLICDSGYTPNESTEDMALDYIQSCYRASGWKISAAYSLTTTAPNTYCRAPGSVQGIAFIEHILEHVAFTLKLDPLEVRIRNLIKAGDVLIEPPDEKFSGINPIPEMIEKLKTACGYEERKKFIKEFNEGNKFVKKGLALMPMRYHQPYPGFIVRLPCYICVYHVDGSVAVSHGGIEMGQGVNTKCAQTVAKFLNIPLEKVIVYPTNTLVSPNAGVSGLAVTSELVCHAAMEACKLLLAKMEPIKKQMKNPSWDELVKKCHKDHILLTAQYQDKPENLKAYDVWAVCCTEVEIDVLTGEFKISRVDLTEDTGLSLSPNIDIGQIEGAFVMGIGFWTLEHLEYDRATGELLTNNTWEYKVPFPKDIPEDFRISLVQTKNRVGPVGVLRSKTTGEPPICLSVSILFALRSAINAARSDTGSHDWYQMDGPVTPQIVQRLSLATKDHFEI